MCWEHGVIRIENRRCGSRRGIALIVTVGFLAVMLLLAMAFSVSMRVERLAAKNFSDVISSRQWAQSAIARAMQDADASCSNSMVLPRASHILSSVGNGNVWLFTGSATNYIPGALSSAATGVNPQWIQAKDDLGAAVGRYAYEVFDCSGFIDANFGLVTNAPQKPRATAASPMDIWLDDTGVLTPELQSGKADDLKLGRISGAGNIAAWPWHELMSPAELWPMLGPGTHSADIFGSFPQSFFTYSRFPRGWLLNQPNGNVVIDPINLNIDWNNTDAATDARTRIAAVFRAMPGFPVGNEDSVAACIQDYCDSDDKPFLNPYSYFDTDATPLLNEMSFEFTVVNLGGGTNELHIQPHVEAWYPFVGVTNPNSQKYSFELSFVMSGASVNISTNIGFGGGRQNVNLRPWSGGTIWTYNTYACPRPGALPNSIPEWVVRTNAAVNFAGASAKIKAAIVDEGGNLVDGVQNLTMSLASVVADGNKHTLGKACKDPRFNNELTDWVDTSDTPGGLMTMPPAQAAPGLNVGVCNVSNTDFAAGSTNFWIYMPDGPMKSVGELGLLAFDPARPWHTISLLCGKPDFMPVLDRFTLNTNLIRRGLINANAWNPAVLATAFNNSPIQSYPGEPSGVVLDPSQPDRDPRIVASAIIGQTTITPFTNLSEVGFANLSGIAGVIGKIKNQVATPDCYYEGLIRDTAGILGVRQNVFVILVAGQSGVDANGRDGIEDAEVTGEQRAIAIVWRDPYPSMMRTPGENPPSYHPSFVRFFHWLTE